MERLPTIHKDIKVFAQWYEGRSSRELLCMNRGIFGKAALKSRERGAGQGRAGNGRKKGCLRSFYGDEFDEFDGKSNETCEAEESGSLYGQGNDGGMMSGNDSAKEEI